MKLIVGLGNPGKEYSKTRHNIGFMIVDKYVSNKNLTGKEKFNSIYYETKINNEKLLIMKPLTFMNLSGTSVKELVSYFKIKLEDILVIYDDKDFENGVFKLKANGSSAGHNGIQNIMDCLNTENIKRLRVGIGRNEYNLKDYVLGKFSTEEESIINNEMDTLLEIIDDFVILDFEKLMSKYN